ncbi:MAG TPA: hypothetical protein VHU80_00400, partial [Polyangiaceae bacterium]|nr:hypothetical protein [Polyangiaceae bacterium]
MPKAVRTLAAVAAMLVAGQGCKNKVDPPGGEAAASSGLGAPPSTALPEPLPGERVEVPAGTFKAGSLPGEAGRRPDVEQRRTDVQLGPFRIDRLPYPDDPKLPSRTGVTRDEAEHLCEERESRLCTELEWERVCRGTDARLFPSGGTWNAACGKGPLGCASGFDVLAMGTLREWTSSDVGVESGARKASVRGAPGSASAELHRCAARAGERPDAKSDDL